jgi:hypothetical protein
VFETINAKMNDKECNPLPLPYYFHVMGLQILFSSSSKIELILVDDIGALGGPKCKVNPCVMLTPT